MKSSNMSISKEWIGSPMKDPPLSVVLKDHLGKSGGTERFH